MEISSEIHKTLLNLKEKKDRLNEDVLKDKKEKEDLEKELIEIELSINKCTIDISNKDKKLDELNGTINEIEKGYNKIIDAGETLMAIISQNVSNLDIELDSDNE